MIGGLQDWDSLTRLKWSGALFCAAVGGAPPHRLRRGHSGNLDLAQFGAAVSRSRRSARFASRLNSKNVCRAPNSGA